MTEQSTTTTSPLLPDLEDDPHRFFWTLTHFRRWISSVFPQISGDYDITLQQLTVLYLVRTQNATMADVARYLHIAPTVVTTMVDGLEESKMISRERHPSDRRKHQLVLTDLGVQASIDIEARYSELVGKGLRQLTLEEQQELTRGLQLLKQLITNLEAASPDS